MSYLTQDELDRTIDIPVSMPAANIESSDWIVVSTFVLRQGQTATFRHLSLHILGASIDNEAVNLADNCNPVDIQRINLSFGIAYVGIAKDYSATVNPDTVTWVGTAADVINATSSGVFSRDVTASPLVIDTPGNYTFVAVNNCQSAVSVDPNETTTYNLDVKMAITGQVRITS